MSSRVLVASALVAVAAAGSVADAAPKSFTKSVAYSDSTPDPSGNLNDAESDHCSGKLPKEKGITVKIPGPGYVDVRIYGFQGDWSLQIRDAKGSVLSGADVNPPEFEATAVRLKKAATINIFPCNMSGTPSAKVVYKYTYKR